MSAVVVLGFGKYRGKRLADVETGYLEWLARQAWPSPWLRRAVTAELKRRAEAADGSAGLARS
jgi:uncharacterized protein (DUF3820 family)